MPLKKENQHFFKSMSVGSYKKHQINRGAGDGSTVVSTGHYQPVEEAITELPPTLMIQYFNDLTHCIAID